jgi:D-alanine-D-alanine ligase
MSVEKTAHDVLQAVTQLDYSAFLLPVGSNLKKVLTWIEESRPDVIINLCEGYRGHPHFEPHIAALLEIAGLAFTGNPAKTLWLCQDKFKTKSLLKSFGFQTPECELVHSLDHQVRIPFPLIVKPNNEDASLGIGVDSIVQDQIQLRRKISDLINTFGSPVLVEKYVEGREFSVAVFEDHHPVALQVSEIDFSGLLSAFLPVCTYESKWLVGHPLYENSVPQCPASIDNDLKNKLQRRAVKVFRDLECRDYAKVDFRVSSDSVPYILEVNPNPDISIDAGYARALTASGFHYLEFWEKMIYKALRRQNYHDKIHAKIRQNAAN